MSSFGGLILTNKGKTLQSKAQTGVQLNFTRIGAGDGNLGSQSILALNDLINEVKSLNISKLKFISGERSVVGGTLSNQEITTGFYFREIGVFAEDPDAGEILYCYGNAGELAEYIPPGGEDVIEKTIDVDMFVGNAENVTAMIDDSLVFATKEQLDVKFDEHLSYETQPIFEENEGEVSIDFRNKFFFVDSNDDVFYYSNGDGNAGSSLGENGLINLWRVIE